MIFLKLFYKDLAKSCDVSLHLAFMQQCECRTKTLTISFSFLALHFFKQYTKGTKLNQSEKTEVSKSPEQYI